jgi:hypothetical protein
MEIARMISRIAVVALVAVLLAATAQAQLVNRAQGIPIVPITNTVMGDPAWVTDGEFGGTWYSYQGSSYNTCSFTIDLGSSYPVSSIVIGQSQVYRFTLHSSVDGETWTQRTHVDYDGSVANTVTIPVNGAYSARYFRYFADADWPQYVGVSEFQVFTGAAQSVPALTPWALAGLAILMLGCGALMLRPRTA